MEIWKPVKGYEGYYEVSNFGQVRNAKTKQILSPSDNGQKLQVTLSKEGAKKAHAVHRLVAEAFIVNDCPDYKTQVNHKDNNRYNNCVDNLEWVTPSENTTHAYVNGYNSKAKIVYQMDGEEYIAMYYSTREAERATGIAASSISAVALGKRKTAGGFRWTYRVPRQKVFMDFTLSLANLSKCEERGVAAVITDKELMQVYSIGINGGPKGLQDCLCRIDGKYGCLHAENQAIAKCLSDAKDKVMFVTLAPCKQCATAIINAPGGFSRVYYHEDWKEDTGLKLLKAAGIQVIKL